MQRILLLMLFGIFAAASFAQESADDGTDETESSESQTEGNDDPEMDEPEPIVDDEFYQDIEDEDFRPSEDIPADQSIPFPTDI